MKTAVIKPVALAAMIALGGIPALASATGIPTVDVAAALQLVQNAFEQAEQAKAQLDEAQNAISQAKSQFDEMKSLTTGNSGYGNYYNDSNMTSYLPTTTTNGSWQQIYSSFDSSKLTALRQQYGLVSDDAQQQEVFDKKLINLATAQEQYAANNYRLENIKKLQQEADNAVTPQQKEDISNRIKTEQAAIANETNRQTTSKELMDKQDALLAQKQNADFDDFMKNGK
ncbi:type IV secretion system protein (plasmid) [Pseudomonas alloputida]|uniref:type IV secretion system protein n=1 Tax=Pseudomonas alloputida TaxID=1940621 RepID=UPI003B42D62A